MTFKMDDYVDVAERIREFSAKYPEGSLQSLMQFVDGGVLCVAKAYRTADDARPGMGHAFEPIPGKTPYTKDSEVMNAETSAWGRAIVALGFETKKIASKQEVEARTGGSSSSPQAAQPAAGAASSHPQAGSAAPAFKAPDALGLKESRADNVPVSQAVAEATGATDKQKALIQRLAKKLNVPSLPDLDSLGKRDASALIEQLKAKEAEEDGLPFAWLDGYALEPGVYRDPWRR